jgi:hypothetical protein
MRGLILCLFVFSGHLASAESTKIYVQAQSTHLKAQPLSDSAETLAVKRGEELELVKSEGAWLQVKTNGKAIGWIPKPLTSKLKPVGQTQLLKDTAKLDSSAKTSRKRTSDYAVSAATRGLASSEKHRPGDAVFRSNRQAVEELEKLKIKPEKIEQFKKEADLKGL